VTLACSIHLSLNAPNALIQETVRAYNATWYNDIVTKLPRIEGGFAYPPDGIGIGTELRESLLKDRRLRKRVSEM
jgi:L-alanine-DL-glutamate epimerase-like enolase superfamily enzyme